MVRTKKHFRPPSSSSSGSSSSEEEEDDDVNHSVPTGRGKQLGNFGRGKQLNMATAAAAGRGKQLRAPVPESEDGSSDESSSSESEEEEDDDDEALPPPPTSRGKQLRPPAVGRGKQLRAPTTATTTTTAATENEETDSSTSAAQQAMTAAVARGGGKQFGRSVGKQLAMQTTPTIDEEDDSDSSSDEEPWAAPVVQRGQGKQLRPPPTTAAEAEEEEEESDMEESSEEEEEEETEVLKMTNKAKPPKATVTEPPQKDGEKESDFEPEEKSAPPPKRARGRPPARAAATRAARSTKEAAKKESLPSEEEDEDDDDDESVEESNEEGSDDSSDEEQEWDMETFDTQKLVKGAEDKKYLDSLPELERENILAERFEKLKSEADMKKALRENKRKEREQKKSLGAKNKKRTRSSSTPSSAKATPTKKRGAAKKKAEIDSEDDGAPDTSGDVALAQSLAGKRVSARNLDKKGKQFKKQAALAKIRENRANKHAAVDESDSELDYGRDSDDSDDDYEESNMLKPWQQKGSKKQMSVSSDEELAGDEDDQQTPVGSAKRRTEDLEAELEDYHKVMVPRRKLIHMCNEPYFEKAVKNFYVRLGIGRDKLTQKPCYRLCKIVGVTSKSEYNFSPVENQKQVSTDKWLKLSFGKTVKEFKMLTVSDHRPSAEEVNQLITQLKIERLTDSILTKKSAVKLCKRQDELVTNYTYTKEDVDMLITEKKRRNKKALNIGYEKTRIAIAVRAAQDEVEEATKNLEDAKVERMEADDNMVAIAEASVQKSEKDLEIATRKLEERIEEQQRILKEEQDRINRMKKSSKIQNWVKVNQRAKLANRNADFESYKEQLAKEKIQGSAEPKFDPYARRRVKPKNLWEVGGTRSIENVSEINNSGVVVEEEKKEATERDDANVGKGDDKDIKRDDIPALQKSLLPGQATQFAFDDEIMIGGDVTNAGGIGTKKIQARSRKGLSLDEYQERKSSGTL